MIFTKVYSPGENGRCTRSWKPVWLLQFSLCWWDRPVFVFFDRPYFLMQHKLCFVPLTQPWSYDKFLSAFKQTSSNVIKRTYLVYYSFSLISLEMLSFIHDESLFAWCHKSLLAWLKTVFCHVFLKSLPSFVCSEVFKLKHSSRMSIKHQLISILSKAFLFHLPNSNKTNCIRMSESPYHLVHTTDSSGKVIWLELVSFQHFHMNYFFFFWS